MRIRRDLQKNKEERMKGDPSDFADACRLMFRISIGEKEFPVDIEALDDWMEHNDPAAESKHAYERKRNAIVAAFVAHNDVEVGELLAELHQLVHLLRALPLAHAGAKQSRTNSKNASGPRVLTPGEEDHIRKRYAEKEASGETYGAIKAFAAEYSVSRGTISNTINPKNKLN